MLTGYYYLHKNGELIYKRELGDTAADLRESDLVVNFWGVDPQDRMCCWRILVESLSSGANKKQVMELAAKWGCDDSDAKIYAEYIECKLGEDGNQKTATRTDFTNIQESPIGFGDTYLEAMAALCKDLGYTGGKTWPSNFGILLTQKRGSK